MQDGRIRTCIDAEFDVGGRRANGRIRNVSESGIFVGTESIPEEGENVELMFRARNGEQLSVTGLVWWTTAHTGRHHRLPGFGLRLLDENDGFRRFWASLQ